MAARGWRERVREHTMCPMAKIRRGVAGEHSASPPLLPLLGQLGLPIALALCLTRRLPRKAPAVHLLDPRRGIALLDDLERFRDDDAYASTRAHRRDGAARRLRPTVQGNAPRQQHRRHRRSSEYRSRNAAAPAVPDAAAGVAAAVGAAAAAGGPPLLLCRRRFEKARVAAGPAEAQDL